MMTTEKTRVILVDDHETVREGLRALFQGLEDVEIVSDLADGSQALEAVAASAPDLLVLDLSMPTDGFAVLRRMKQEAPDTPVVVLTRHRESAYVREAFAAGAVGYVLKQSPFQELKAAIQAVARGERYVDPRLAGGAGFIAGDTQVRLSDREQDVLRRAALGHSNKEIAAAFGIAVKTVEVHKANAMRKLSLKDRSDVVRYGVLRGWLADV